MGSSRPLITGRRGIVATGHYLATEAGLKMFTRGGNAIDAGVAAGIALSVLKPHQNTLGGECPILVYSSQDCKVTAISGQGTAPARATTQWFKEKGFTSIPGARFLAATVPGTFGAYASALMWYGRLGLKDVLEPAIQLAWNGFPMYQGLWKTLMVLKNRFTTEWPTSGHVYLPGGEVPILGHLLKQPELAATLEGIVSAEMSGTGKGSRATGIQYAIDHFYRGRIAEQILEFSRNTPLTEPDGIAYTALLDWEDFKGYETRFENPISTSYSNVKVFKCGPWTQGPVFLQQLKLLEGFNLKKMGHNTADYIHTIVECAKLAFADRECYYGDPLFSDIPMDMLLSEEHAASMREKIHMDRANNNHAWKTGPSSEEKGLWGDTTHLDVADEDGNMISITPSGGWIPTSPVIPGVGFPLGTRAQVFNLKEGHPNCLQPGKRPRTTLTPSLAFRDSRPWLAFGTPGGDMQDQWTLQFLLNIVEFGMNMQEAVEAPSFHTKHFPDSFYPHNVVEGKVFIESDIDKEQIIRLQARGHGIHLLQENSNGEVCAAGFQQTTGVLEGAASPKEEGNAYAMGW